MLIISSGLGLLRQICRLRVTLPHHRIVSVDGDVPDLVLTDVLDVVRVQVGSSVGNSDHSAVLTPARYKAPQKNSRFTRVALLLPVPLL